MEHFPCPGCKQDIPVTIDKHYHRHVGHDIVTTGYYDCTKYVHDKCFQCEKCDKKLSVDSMFYDKLLCHEHVIENKIVKLSKSRDIVKRSELKYKFLVEMLKWIFDDSSTLCQLVADYAFVSNMFVLLAETSGKENETWYWYLQFDGNEQEIARLAIQLDYCSKSPVGDLSFFELYLNRLVPKSKAKAVVEYHSTNSYTDHSILTGKMKPLEMKLNKNLGPKTIAYNVEQYSYARENIMKQNVILCNEFIGGGDISKYFIYH